MSKLEELIQKYCPDGVEYVRLGDVLKVNRGKRLTKSQLSEDGQYPVYHGSKDTPLGKYTEFNVKGNTTIVVNTGGIGGVKFCANDFWCSDGSFWIGHSSKLNDKFVYYYISPLESYFASQKRVGGVPTIDRSVVENVEIPIPPLPVQEEIVRVLDTFTELQAELQAELQKRLQQYNYYRDNLLSFEDRTDVEYLPIQNFAELKAGKAIKAEELVDLPDDNHPYPCFGGNGIRGYIAKKSHCGDYAIIGRQGALCGCVNWASGVFYATEHAVVCKPLNGVNSRFLFYLFTAANLNQYKSQGAQPGLSVQRLNELVFPIPSLSEQQQIVDVLDRFEILTNDLSAGLPAEIEKRRQQYEYYRDKLLTFKRAN